MRAVLFSLVLSCAVAGCASAPPTQGALAGRIGGPGQPADADLLSGGRASGAELERRVAEASRHPLGSRENPVRVNMPQGQRAYLARLRCSDGRAPAFMRVGNFGFGPFGSIIDGYDVRCEGGEPARSMIFMDMYHPTHDELAAPAGFTLASGPGEHAI